MDVLTHMWQGHTTVILSDPFFWKLCTLAKVVHEMSRSVSHIVSACVKVGNNVTCWAIQMLVGGRRGFVRIAFWRSLLVQEWCIVHAPCTLSELGLTPHSS